MTHTTHEPRIDGHLRFLDEKGDRQELSMYTFEVIDTRARRGLRRWFKITPHEAILENPSGFDSPEELEADIRDFVAILGMEEIRVEGRIDVTPNDCESITYTVSGDAIDVTRQSCD